VLREGLTIASRENDEKIESRLANQLGSVLLAKGDPEGALPYVQRALKIVYTQRALKILEDSYGPDNPLTKKAAANLEQLLRVRQR